MVNNTNLYYKNNPKLTEPPAVDDIDSSDRLIQKTPIWDLKELVSLVETALKQDTSDIHLATVKAKRDFEVLESNGFDLLSTLKQINPTKGYKNSTWCKTSAEDKHGKQRGKGSWIPCDAYTVTCEYEHPVTGYCGKAEYYFKMCKGLNGKMVLIVSVHL